uniref:Ig-like domain-containing protein n=1 Tax=Junco hyemalis TaxID=40217 RepID=A0A8C5IWG5_JUNHY
MALLCQPAIPSLLLLPSQPLAPEIQEGPQEVKVLLNTSAVLPCRAQGWPVPRVTWRKDGQLLPLPGSDRYEPLWVGGTKSCLSGRATLHSNRWLVCQSRCELLCSVLTPA